MSLSFPISGPQKKRIAPVGQAIIGLALLFAAASTSAEAADPKEKGGTGETPPAATTTANGELDLNTKLTGLDGVDFLCETEVYYLSRRNPKPATKQNPNPETSEWVETFYTRLGERGLIGQDVKNRVLGKLPELKGEAVKACKRDNEDRADCLATRLKNSSLEYRQMDYESRRTLLKAIENDCEELRGECGEAKVKPVRCFLSRPATMGSGEEAKEEGKEDKDKKKKK